MRMNGWTAPREWGWAGEGGREWTARDGSREAYRQMAERKAGTVRVGSGTTTVTARPRRRQTSANSITGVRWLMLWPGTRTTILAVAMGELF
jgi:hypothetical protein